MSSETQTALEGTKNKKSTISIVDVFGSKGRIKILSLLVRKGELNISEIAVLTRVNHNTAAFHLKSLADSEIVIMKQFGRIKIFEMNRNSPFSELIRGFIQTFDALVEADALGISKD